MPLGQGVDHERRRQHDEADVAVGVEAGRGQPVAELVIVPREGEDHGDGERRRARRAALRDDRGDRLRDGRRSAARRPPSAAISL